MGDFGATIAIVTRNRADSLRRALVSAVAQTGSYEVLVIDDGSADGTPAMVRNEFPMVKLETRSESHGYIVRRNEAARLASADVVVSIDDDAEFSSARSVEQTLAEFDHCRIGAIAIPFVNVLQSDRVLQRAPAEQEPFTTDSFIGTAHAVHRDLFIRLGGYREELTHQGEERDFCLRMLAAGYVVRLGTADPILHYESAARNLNRMDHFGRRNDILYATQNVPMPYLPIHLVGTTIHGLFFGWNCGRFRNHAAGIAAGYRDSLGLWSKRNPVSSDVYRLQRQLRKYGPVKLSEIEARLPDLSDDQS